MPYGERRKSFGRGASCDQNGVCIIAGFGSEGHATVDVAG